MTHANLATLEHRNWIAYLTGVVSCSKGANVRRDGGVVSERRGFQAVVRYAAYGEANPRLRARRRFAMTVTEASRRRDDG